MSAMLRQEDKPMLEERVAKIESDVGHLNREVAEIKAHQWEMRKDLNSLRDEFHSFRVEVTREFGNIRTELRAGMETLRTAIERSKLWMIVAAAGFIATAIGTLASLGRVMKWF